MIEQKLTFKMSTLQTCDPPARETESTAFETLSRPPEKKIKISRLFKIQKKIYFFFLQKILKIFGIVWI
jgi:hypothetical protein